MHVPAHLLRVVHFVTSVGTMPILLIVFCAVAAALTPQTGSPAPGNPVVVVSTSAGDITLELFKDRAPVSVENFLQYVREGHYEGTIFHRVILDFMIQGGGYTP